MYKTIDSISDFQSLQYWKVFYNKTNRTDTYTMLSNVIYSSNYTRPCHTEINKSHYRNQQNLTGFNASMRQNFDHKMMF